MAQFDAGPSPWSTHPPRPPPDAKRGLRPRAAGDAGGSARRPLVRLHPAHLTLVVARASVGISGVQLDHRHHLHRLLAQIDAHLLHLALALRAGRLPRLGAFDRSAACAAPPRTVHPPPQLAAPSRCSSARSARGAALPVGRRQRGLQATGRLRRRVRLEALDVSSTRPARLPISGPFRDGQRVDGRRGGAAAASADLGLGEHRHPRL